MVEKKLSQPAGSRVGIDENGLGPRLGPMIVTAALADVSEEGARRIGRKLPKALRVDLDDSKALVSCHDVSLGEAWTRVVVEETQGVSPKTPSELLLHVLSEDERSLTQDCPKSTKRQCWNADGEQFAATREQLDRIRRHVATLEKRGIGLRRVSSEVVCAQRLNRLKKEGIHRFTADLHAMERLVLKFREAAGQPVVATCGKVGGIGKYEPFFGPLSGRLHTTLEEGRARSCYHFPTLGELRFVRDADASDPLVMLASLVGKYVREVLMRRISRFYAPHLDDPNLVPSGYHDPVTNRFVDATKQIRKRLRIASDCFQR